MIKFAYEAHKIPRSEVIEGFLGEVKKGRSAEMNYFLEGFDDEWTRLSSKKKVKKNSLSSDGIERKIGEYVRAFGIDDLSGKKLMEWLDEEGYKVETKDVKKGIKKYLGVQDANNLISFVDNPSLTVSGTTTTDTTNIEIKKEDAPLSWDLMTTTEREEKLKKSGYDGFDAFKLSLLEYDELPEKAKIKTI